MTTVRESSNGTGPTLPGFETCETATEPMRIPTPQAADGSEVATGFGLRDYVNGRRRYSPTLTSSAAASPASRLATPAFARVTLMIGGSGQSSTESFARFDPDGRCLKTYQGSCQLMMDGSFEEYCGTWPKRGTMRNGSCYPPPLSERPTSDRESSLWPTPTATERENDISAIPSETGLRRAVYRSPQARDGMERGASSPERRLEQGHSVSLHDQIGGQLSATWTELLMGLPAGWTEVE